MKKSNLPYVLLTAFGFLFFMVGGMLLMVGAYVENTVVLYVGISLILIGICFYVVLAILAFVHYSRKRKAVK